MNPSRKISSGAIAFAPLHELGGLTGALVTCSWGRTTEALRHTDAVLHSPGATLGFVVLAFVLCVAGGAMLVAAILLRRRTRGRMRLLLEGLDHFRAGEAHVRIEPGARDELGGLAEAFNALSASEERFRQALDDAPIGTALVDLDGRFLRVNSVLCESVGYTHEELTGLTFQAITHPDDVAVDVALTKDLAAGRIPRYHLDKRYIRKDGSIVDVELSVSLARGVDGMPLYFIVQIEDVTERKRAAEALRRSEVQFRGLIERLPDGVIVHRDGCVVYANPALATLLGYDDPAELAGRCLAELHHHDDRWLLEESARALQSGRSTPPLELRMLQRDGTPSCVETTTIQCQFDEEPAVLVAVRDLTDRKRAERAREESLQRLRAVVDVTPVGMALCTDGEHWELNPRACELLGGRAVWPEPGTCHGSVVDLDDRPLPVDDLPSKRALRGERLAAVELRIRHPDGRTVPVLVSAAPIKGQETTQSGAVVTFEDITHLKDLERLRIEWGSIIAHDLRQPLQSINTCAELIAVRSANDAALSKLARQIGNLVRRLNRMILDLLDFSRIEARQLHLDRRPINLIDVVRESADRIALEAPDRAVDLHVQGGRARVDADPDRIAQVMENLLSNAVKYGKPATPIVVTVKTNSDDAVVSVTNQGCGIPPEQLPRLFGRFQRAEDIKGSVKGIGLGLYITRELVEAHGGRVTVESRPGDLTTFRFTLPLVPRALLVPDLERHPS